MDDRLWTGKPSLYVTSQLANSAFHPYGVDKSSTNLPGWGEGGAVTSLRSVRSFTFFICVMSTYRSDNIESTAGSVQLLQEEHDGHRNSQRRSLTEGQLPRQEQGQVLGVL